MKEAKIKKLFAAARKEPAPETNSYFSRNVISAIRREERPNSVPSLQDQLAQLFPRLAWAAVLIIAVCVMTDLYFSQNEGSLSAGVDQITEQWLFAANANE